MELMEKLNHYLASQAYVLTHGGIEKSSAPAWPFLTISRESGAGGHSLANALLEEMARRNDDLWAGWKVFDAAFCSQILNDAKMRASLESLHKEETPSAWEGTIYELIGARGTPEKVYWETFHAMRLLAQMGKLIVIGRGGACATKDLPFGVHVRLIAPLPMRIERMQQRLRISKANAARLVEEYDIARAKFVRVHFGQDIQDPLLYHAIWNTERTPFAEIAHVLLEMMEKRIANERLLKGFPS